MTVLFEDQEIDTSTVLYTEQYSIEISRAEKYSQSLLSGRNLLDYIAVKCHVGPSCTVLYRVCSAAGTVQSCPVQNRNSSNQFGSVQ